jgi:hypothetical protein
MKLHLPLLRWYLKETMTITLIALPIACAYVMFTPGVIRMQNGFPPCFILLHCLALEWRVATPDHPYVAFLYTRGYSRNTLWFHRMLGVMVPALIVWTIAALLIWLGLRSHYQDVVMESVYFPIMAPRETNVPLCWIVTYALLLTVFSYSWIRASQPDRDRGTWIALATIAAVFNVMFNDYSREWIRHLLFAIAVVPILVALVFGRLLHKRMEVRA